MASLRERKGNYFVDYRVNGIRYREPVGRSKKIALLALKDIEVKIAKGELGFDRKDTEIDHIFTEYFTYSKTNHSPNTQKRYKAIIDNFKTFLEKKPHLIKISQLSLKFFEDYKAFRKGQGAENKTVNMELRTLRTIFSLAVKWKYAQENPTDGINFLKIENGETPRFLSDEECETLLKSCDEFLYPVFYAFLSTGMRKGELLNLEWKDVDFDRKKLKIRAKAGWTPKTSAREIPINNGLYELLQKQKKKAGDSTYVFPDENGQSIQSNRLRKRLMTLTKKCGFPDVTKLHTLRHTFASHLVMKGVDLPTIKKLMGHSDIQTTMIYSHLADEHIDKAVEKLEF